MQEHQIDVFDAELQHIDLDRGKRRGFRTNGRVDLGGDEDGGASQPGLDRIRDGSLHEEVVEQMAPVVQMHAR